jgi:hypothetical protein
MPQGLCTGSSPAVLTEDRLSVIHQDPREGSMPLL